MLLPLLSPEADAAAVAATTTDDSCTLQQKLQLLDAAAADACH